MNRDGIPPGAAIGAASTVKTMDIGLITQLHHRPEAKTSPGWDSILDLALTAEREGFDIFVFEDVLMYRVEGKAHGCWESGALAGALAAATETIRFGQSVVNSPYRSPALVAAAATTLDEISNGRYVLGIGAGNSDDYADFGFPADRRYSRFAEAMHIIHSLLKTGRAKFDGNFFTVANAELDLRGPSPEGPPINIAAGSPKMMRLVARYADAWNWWGWDERLDEIKERVTPIVEDLERACDELGRDSSEIVRTFDLYSVVPPGFDPGSEMKQSVAGGASKIADYILSLGDLGFTEVRCDLTDKSPAAVAAMGEVVDLVHSG